MPQNINNNSDYRTQPNLFDRLTADKNENFDDIGVLKDSVLHNIRNLLNSRAHLTRRDLEKDDEVYYSVLGYGVEDFCGMSRTDFHLERLTEGIRGQIVHFEPRLDPDSVRVEIVAAGEHAGSEIKIRINGKIGGEQYFTDVECDFILDLESGKTVLRTGAN